MNSEYPFAPRRSNRAFASLSACLLLSIFFLTGCPKDNTPSPDAGKYKVTTVVGGGAPGYADGLGLTANFSFPVGLAIDKNGNLYVTDYANNTIRMVTLAGLVSTLAGNAQAGSGHADGTGSAASFNEPYGITLDANGNLIVADGFNSEIRMVTPGGAVTTVAGTLGDPVSADGTGAAAHLSPKGITTDGKGVFYVTDGNKIRKITAGWVVTTLAGGAFAPSADGIGSAAGFNDPVGIAIDSKGNLFVTDGLNHNIRKIAPGAVVTTFAGNVSAAGNVDGTGTNAQFIYPSGIAIDSKDNLFVTDGESNTIRKITPQGVVTTIAGNALVPPGNTDGIDSIARFNSPAGIVVDHNDNLYVADAGNNIIRMLTKQ